MSDSRLREWLLLTERVLAVEEGRGVEALLDLALRREELQAELSRSRECARDPELAERLEQAELRLAALMDRLRADLQGKLNELRKVRSATSGYRPVDDRIPAFLSKSI